jgi:ligand-binding sensor domain-containing protein
MNFLGALLLLSGIPGLVADSQTWYFDNYSTQQEFESKVYCIVQDSDRYVWLGTPTGVWRFEGRSFTNYSQVNGLAEGSVRALFIDHNGVLWLGHEGGGLTRRNGTGFEHLAVLDSVLKSNITSINEDAGNNLWITTESDGALVIKNPAGAVSSIKFEHFLKGKSLGDQVFSSLQTSDGSLFFVTNVGIRKYNHNKNSFEAYLPKGLSTYFSISVMFEDSRGNLWFGTYNGGLSKMDHNDQSFTYYDTGDGLASNWITSITEDRAGNIWIGHWKDNVNTGGISKISPSGKLQVFNTTNGLHDDHIWCIRQDTDGNLLIGTTDQGLEIFKGEKFVSFLTAAGSVNNQVNAITESKPGEIWFGTNQGISVYNTDGKNTGLKQINQSSHFISNQINFFRKDHNNNVWIGTGDEGVLLYNTQTGRFISQPAINSYLPYYQTLSKGITALEITADGHLWIGTIEGLVEYDINKDSYIATYTQGTGLAGNEISALFADSRGVLWIGSGKGKGITVMRNRKFSMIKNLADITPNCFCEDPAGKIWIGTDSKGIFVLNNDSVSHYGVEDGLLSNHINLLYSDALNNIYAGSNLGLNKIDQQRKKTVSYTRKTGFTGIETKPNSAFADIQGFLWIGTANGAMRCDVNLLSREDTARPAIRITDILVKGLPLQAGKERRFSSNENDFTFKYGSISFSNPEGITYQVMLDGYDEQWQDQGNDITRVYNRLNAGRYTFRVRARNEYGEWSEKPAEFSFHILAPFYKRGYFIVTVICLVL